jgi:hypothetical protein
MPLFLRIMRITVVTFPQLMRKVHRLEEDWEWNSKSSTKGTVAMSCFHYLTIITTQTTADRLSDNTAQHRSPPLTRTIWLHFSPARLMMMLMISVSKLVHHPVASTQVTHMITMEWIASSVWLYYQNNSSTSVSEIVLPSGYFATGDQPQNQRRGFYDQ